MLVEWLKEAAAGLCGNAADRTARRRAAAALLHSPLRYLPPAAARLLTAINWRPAPGAGFLPGGRRSPPNR